MSCGVFIAPRTTAQLSYTKARQLSTLRWEVLRLVRPYGAQRGREVRRKLMSTDAQEIICYHVGHEHQLCSHRMFGQSLSPHDSWHRRRLTY
jgi:hypothetical protein